MPVILNPEAELVWLDKQSSLPDCINVLKPYSADKIKYYSVSSQVNSVRNDDARLIVPTPAMDQSGNLTLFD
jgi:putative SOS response-associated peptidase YedK